MGTEHSISVAVYWPNEGYGIPKSVASMEEAQTVAAEWVKQGYGTGKSCIRILETTRTITDYVASAGQSGGQSDG